jgi:hypothetical protein
LRIKLLIALVPEDAATWVMMYGGYCFVVVLGGKKCFLSPPILILPTMSNAISMISSVSLGTHILDSGRVNVHGGRLLFGVNKSDCSCIRDGYNGDRDPLSFSESENMDDEFSLKYERSETEGVVDESFMVCNDVVIVLFRRLQLFQVDTNMNLIMF